MRGAVRQRLPREHGMREECGALERPGAEREGCFAPRSRVEWSSMTEIRNLKIGFIGFGNMGSGIAEGMLSSGRIAAVQLYACGAHFEKCEKRCAELGGINARKTPEEVVQEAELLFLCVKPNLAESVLSSLKERLSGKVIVSIIWGYEFDRLSVLLPADVQLLCTCPNTPVSIGRGIFVVERKHSLHDAEFMEVTDILSAMSTIVMAETAQMGIAGILSSCGAAFADLFMEALADAGVMYGLPRKTAYALSAGMLEGTAAMQEATRLHPGVMKDAVCSPGGATIRGVAKLEEKAFRSAVLSAVQAIQED